MSMSLLRLSSTILFCCSFHLAMADNTDFSRFLSDQTHGTNFTIDNANTVIKRENRANYNIKSSNRQDRIWYYPDEKSIKSGLFGSRVANSIRVERNHKRRSPNKGAVERITSVSFDVLDGGVSKKDAAESTHIKSAETYVFDESGKIENTTICLEDFQLNNSNRKRKRSGNTCLTLTPHICKYINDKNIDKLINQEMKACGDTLNRIKGHQAYIQDSVKDIASSDLRSIRRDTKVNRLNHFHEVPPSTLENLSQLSYGFNQALHHCDRLQADFASVRTLTVTEKKDSQKSKKK